MTREKFLSKISDATETVNKQVAKTHQLVLEAVQTNKEGAAVDQIEVDLSTYTNEFTAPILAYAQSTLHNTVDTKPCVDSYMTEKDYVAGYLRVDAMGFIKEKMQDVIDTATKADTLLATMASLMQQGKAEAAKPDGEYGKNIDTILAAVEKASGTAQWNNDHVETVLYDLRDATDLAITFSYSDNDMPAIRDYAKFCMRRVVKQH